jgi:hypothetical protein
MKETCWKLEANKRKRPEWWTDMVAATVDEGEHLLWMSWSANANAEVVL